MRVKARLQRMRQHQQIQAVFCKRQGRRIGEQVNTPGSHGVALVHTDGVSLHVWRVKHAGRRRRKRQPLVGHAVGTQGVKFAQPQLQRVKSKHIAERLVKTRLLPGQHVSARRSFQPVRQTYNFRVHQDHCMYLFPIPASADNCFGLLHHGKRALVVDPGAAEPVLCVQQHALQLESILVTHHQSAGLAMLHCSSAGHQPFFAYTPSVHQNCCAAL